MSDQVQPTLATVTHCMLAAGKRGQWVTTSELMGLLRREYGLHCTRFDVMNWLRALVTSGTHTLASRERGESSVKEYRLYAGKRSA